MEGGIPDPSAITVGHEYSSILDLVPATTCGGSTPRHLESGTEIRWRAAYHADPSSHASRSRKPDRSRAPPTSYLRPDLVPRVLSASLVRLLESGISCIARG
ncbi:hypothetical protein SCLCIDRAFT_1062599 [Scleroderma citrinum Foug A]|uniref:Uncharacterized protein n=1 Tax=Scleroderma citrinum Foug A TaxID=1036808 RepID=A0A0C2ZA30_9AGAM|nr:hypothetical protein SCLCIDRAFT_1062599 [Scleroderma citrinum Foug A]